MPTTQTIACFFAYPSKPVALAETIETTIGNLNTTGYVYVESWKHLQVSGKIVIGEICKAINTAQLILCDVTHLNSNVLFELGYAVAKNKRVWLALDTSLPKAVSDYKQLKVLSSIGYASYRNSTDLVRAFLEDQPFSSLENTLYTSLISPILQESPRPPKLLYLKCPIETESSQRLSQLLAASHIDTIIDDPAEVSIQSLNWYADQITNSCAVIAHLLDEERSLTDATQNAKYAFISGLAYGLGKTTSNSRTLSLLSTFRLSTPSCSAFFRK